MSNLNLTVTSGSLEKVNNKGNTHVFEIIILQVSGEFALCGKAYFLKTLRRFKAHRLRGHIQIAAYQSGFCFNKKMENNNSNVNKKLQRKSSR